MGFGKYREIARYKKKKGRSYRTVPVKTKNDGTWYAVYLFGREF